LRFDIGALSVSVDPSIDMGIEEDEESIGLILVKDLDPLRIVFVIEEGDVFLDQFYGGFIDSAVKRDGSVTVDFSSGPGAEEVREISGSGPQEVKMLGEPIQRGFFCRAVEVSMIGLVTPLFNPFIEGG